MASSCVKETTIYHCDSSSIIAKPSKKLKICSKHVLKNPCQQNKSLTEHESPIRPHKTSLGSKQATDKQPHFKQKFQELCSSFSDNGALKDNCAFLTEETSRDNFCHSDCKGTLLKVQASNVSQTSSSLQTLGHDSGFLKPSFAAVNRNSTGAQMNCQKRVPSTQMKESKPVFITQAHCLSDISNENLNKKYCIFKRESKLSPRHGNKKVLSTSSDKENQTLSSFVKDLNTVTNSKPFPRTQILISKPEEFHNHRKNQFDLLHTSFLPLEEPIDKTTSNTEINKVIFEEKKSLNKLECSEPDFSLSVQQSESLEVADTDPTVGKWKSHYFSPTTAFHQLNSTRESAEKLSHLKPVSDHERISSLISKMPSHERSMCMDSTINLNFENQSTSEKGFHALSKETAKFPSNECDILFSSVAEWKHFFPCDNSCDGKSNSSDSNSPSELTIATKTHNLPASKNFRSEANEHNSYVNPRTNSNYGSKASLKKTICSPKIFSNLNLVAVKEESIQQPAEHSDNIQQCKPNVNYLKISMKESCSTNFKIPSQTVKQSDTENQVAVKNITKLFIIDLLRVAPTPQRNHYLFNYKIIHRVDVFGVVTGVRLVGDDKVIYEVDDGSGTISCVHSQTRLKAKIQKLNYLLSSKRRDETLNNESLNQTEITIANNSTKEKNSDEDTALRKFQLCMENHSARCEEFIFQIGDTIQAKGVLYDFKDTISFYAYNIRKVVNIEEETVRYLQLAALYQTIFSESRMIVKPEVTAIEDTDHCE
ncbi:uncharacterized protein [Bemisia tabaci]|uniref:uncharacterized protein n=1 Tax=Bemisia tabaci TaxID=7038 RepID=UPI003B27B905